MIDLRSDTLTLPDRPMLETILTARLGDDGRQNEEGRGEDAATNELEDLAAFLTGKEEGLLFSSGTLANTAALLTWCAPGDAVMVDRIQHIYVTEKTAFNKNFGQLIPLCYRFDRKNTPDIDDMRGILKEHRVKLLCLENTHNFSGGTCTPVEKMADIRALAEEYGVPVHLDGARLFNAALALGRDAKEICRNVDSVMFCISKGLGAPVGSLLCGSGEFIRRARDTRRMLGANMRQCGVIAAPGIYALTHNIPRLGDDAANAKCAAERLRTLKKAEAQKDVQTNMVMLDTSKTGLSAPEYCARLKEEGVWISPCLPDQARLVFYQGVTMDDGLKAAEIIEFVDRRL
jgi:threonine aldolase